MNLLAESSAKREKKEENTQRRGNKSLLEKQESKWEWDRKDRKTTVYWLEDSISNKRTSS